MSFISNYSLDLLNTVYCYEAEDAGIPRSEISFPPPIKVKDVHQKIQLFASILATYAIRNEDFKKIYMEIPDVSVAPQDSETVRGMYDDATIDPLQTFYLSNVTLNPIYHVRMMVAEWQYKRYENNKSKKRILELRLLHLRLQNEKSPSQTTSKEIEYLQSRIDGLDKKLSEVKKDLGI